MSSLAINLWLHPVSLPSSRRKRLAFTQHHNPYVAQIYHNTLSSPTITSSIKTQEYTVGTPANDTAAASRSCDCAWLILYIGDILAICSRSGILTCNMLASSPASASYCTLIQISVYGYIDSITPALPRAPLPFIATLLLSGFRPQLRHTPWLAPPHLSYRSSPAKHVLIRSSG